MRLRYHHRLRVWTASCPTCRRHGADTHYTAESLRWVTASLWHHRRTYDHTH